MQEFYKLWHRHKSCSERLMGIRAKTKKPLSAALGREWVKKEDGKSLAIFEKKNGSVLKNGTLDFGNKRNGVIRHDTKEGRKGKSNNSTNRTSEGSYHIETSVWDKSVKLSELHYNVTRNEFSESGTLYSHVGADVGIFRLQNVFFQTMSTYIPLEPQFNAD